MACYDPATTVTYLEKYPLGVSLMNLFVYTTPADSVDSDEMLASLKRYATKLKRPLYRSPTGSVTIVLYSFSAWPGWRCVNPKTLPKVDHTQEWLPACNTAWDRLPPHMQANMDRPTWNMAYQIAWYDGVKASHS